MRAECPPFSVITLIARAAVTSIYSASTLIACRRASSHSSRACLGCRPTVAAHAAPNSSASCPVAASFPRRCRRAILRAASPKGCQEREKKSCVPRGDLREVASCCFGGAKLSDFNRRRLGSAPGLRARAANAAVSSGPRSPCRRFRSPLGASARIAPRSAC